MSLARSAAPPRPASSQGRTARPADAFPVLDARPNSRVTKLAEGSGRSPITVFCLATLAGYLVLAALAIGVGFLLVEALLPINAIEDADEGPTDWLARNRSGSLDDASYVASAIGDIPAIPGLVFLTVIVAALFRRWRVAAFMAGAILVEVATYRITSMIVHRDRPSVPRLDDLPVNQSYPSGHVAASVVVYVGLALLLGSRMRARWATILLWTLAFVLPLVVAVSRMYRGMHHPIDVTAGLLIGLASILIALMAARAADAVSRSRGRAHDNGARQ